LNVKKAITRRMERNADRCVLSLLGVLSELESSDRKRALTWVEEQNAEKSSRPHLGGVRPNTENRRPSKERTRRT